MIGLYGLVGKEQSFASTKIDECFGLMTNGTELETARGQGFVLGIAKRPRHDNKDLVLHRFANGSALAIFGYARFPPEDHYHWAVDLGEPVTKAFLAQGLVALTTLQGCFCICLIHDNRLLVVGDHFGSKKLYYAEVGDSFIFAPDVRSVLCTGLVPRERDLEGAKQILVSGFFVGDRTLVRDIRNFPYGTVLEKQVDPWQQSRMRRYWEPPATEGQMGGSVGELASSLWEKGQSAILRLDALEKRMAVPLSGGLDSRYIASVLAGCRPIKALTYDMSDEVSVARNVVKVLGAEHTLFDNELIEDASFRQSLNCLISEQRNHAVVNQYFYSVLFRKYLETSTDVGIYDGVYLDGLFNAAYVLRDFDQERYAAIYGRGANGIIPAYSRLSPHDWKSVVQHAYEEGCGGHSGLDGVGRSQLIYLVGRLRRYVNECGSDRENYGYVFRPGFDNELCDFGYGLRQGFRKGAVYTAMLQEHFPEVMRIPYKDSKGNRQKTIWEQARGRLEQWRVQLSYASRGLLPFYPYQADLFFYKLGAVADNESLFNDRSYIDEIISHEQMKELYRRCKEKQYLLNIFQRIQFVQQFYKTCGY